MKQRLVMILRDFAVAVKLVVHSGDCDCRGGDGGEGGGIGGGGILTRSGAEGRRGRAEFATAATSLMILDLGQRISHRLA